MYFEGNENRSIYSKCNIRFPFIYIYIYIAMPSHPLEKILYCLPFYLMLTFV